MRYIEGVGRDQMVLLPESLEDFVPMNHPVRVIDAFVSQLDFALLGFSKSATKQTGRKPYHPGDLLKLYLYGYYNQIRSACQSFIGFCKELNVRPVELRRLFPPIVGSTLREITSKKRLFIMTPNKIIILALQVRY